MTKEETMIPTRDFLNKLEDDMKSNIHMLQENFSKNLPTVLKNSFRNILLSVVVIDDCEFPAYSKIFIGKKGIVQLKHHNPLIKKLRAEYDEKRRILLIEKLEMVQHPLISNQRVIGEEAVLCELYGYEAFGYTNPSKKIPEWRTTGKEISLLEINFAEIIPSPDKLYDKNSFKLILSARQ